MISTDNVEDDSDEHDDDDEGNGNSGDDKEDDPDSDNEEIISERLYFEYKPFKDSFCFQIYVYKYTVYKQVFQRSYFHINTKVFNSAQKVSNNKIIMTSRDPYESASLASVANLTKSDPEKIIPLIDYGLYYVIRLVAGAVLTTIIAAIGVFTNTINIIVYSKMGLQETTNINFFSLAIADWLSAMCLIVMQISDNINIRLPSGAKADEITHVTSIFLFAASGTGAFITTILSMERCLCIVIPLKVS
ncbi:harbi1_0 protein [Plakobranchus ocellatus]|uniref:Harbi1_0 protein n=1 Tax=Plakobranchus ocellatus TaxID=259542 RepID=A0AAV3YK23_9GAST|nr:harbi1_0 protein [Plakobranchus ocellatus]